MAVGACLTGALIVVYQSDHQADIDLTSDDPIVEVQTGGGRTLISPAEKDPAILAFQEAAYPEEEEHAVLLQTVDPDGNFHFVDTSRRKTPQGYNMRVFVSPFQGRPALVSADGATTSVKVKADSALIERVRAEQDDAKKKRFQNPGRGGSGKKDR